MFSYVDRTPTLRLLFACAVLTGCTAPPIPPHAGALATRTTVRALAIEPMVTLSDDTARTLARPVWISMDGNGSYFVADRSDKDVKAYGGKGMRLRTIGRAGYGPGEFTGLMAAQTYRDSLAAYDFLSGQITVFDAGGRYARAITVRGKGRPESWSMRVVDDSLFLLVGTPMGAHDRDLLALIRPDGSLVSTFFDQARYFGGNARLVQRTGVIADARDGRVFAALVGGDSLYVFDYAGRRVASHPLDPEEPLVTVKTLLRRNGGKVRDGRGNSILHGNRNAIAMVALDSSTVALQITSYDARMGVDPLEGGTVVVSAVGRDGIVRALARGPVQAGLLGRDRSGRALLLGYATPSGDEYRVMRLGLPAREGAR